MYPINLRLTGVKVGVVGGGKVALRKLQRLLAEGALVTVIAPEIISEITNLLEAHPAGLSWQQVTSEDYAWQPGEFLLVFAATDQAGVNSEICTKAKELGALVNSATEPEEADFFVPANVSCGDLSLTVGTGGISPGFARLIRQDLAARYGESFAAFLTWLGEARRDLQRREPDTRVRQRLWREALQPDLIDLLLQQGLEQAKDEVRRKIGGAGS